MTSPEPGEMKDLCSAGAESKRREDAPTTSELIERINAALSDEHALTGIACKHGWDLAVCVMAECENPYALEPLLTLAASRLADLERERDEADQQPYKDALHDLVMLKAQDDIGCVPPPARGQWDAAWAEAEELTRIEP